MIEHVILVDELDQEIGTLEKLQAHIEGRLHRAISVLVFNDEGKWLLQQRALSKYHSGGLWSNACCTHPRLGELPIDAAKRRLMEEMRIACELEKVFEFTYRVELDKGLTEHEFDHVFVGITNDRPIPNPEEVCDWKWVDFESLQKDIADNPQNYTGWFKILLNHLNFPDQPSLVRKVEK